MSDSNLHIKNFIAIIITLFLVVLFVSREASAQSREVQAQKGEGIYRLLMRHGLSVSEHMASFVELNKDKLGKDNSLLAGIMYKLPDGGEKEPVVPPSKSGGRVVRHEIFGKNYSEIEITDNELLGAVYYLMAGHGGPDPGAIGKYNGKMLCEDEYAYDVTLRLARNLISKGATVYLITRDKNDGIRDDSYLKVDHDEVCYPNLKIPLNQTRRLRQRTQAVNSLSAKNRGKFQRMIAVHVDSRSTGEDIDVFFYHDKRSKTGKKAAQILQSTFSAKYNQHQPGRGYEGSVSSRGLYVVKHTYPVAVYIELGNINHRRDIQRFIIPDNRQAVANWLALGLVKDFKTNK